MWLSSVWSLQACNVRGSFSSVHWTCTLITWETLEWLYYSFYKHIKILFLNYNCEYNLCRESSLLLLNIMENTFYVHIQLLKRTANQEILNIVFTVFLWRLGSLTSTSQYVSVSWISKFWWITGPDQFLNLRQVWLIVGVFNQPFVLFSRRRAEVLLCWGCYVCKGWIISQLLSKPTEQTLPSFCILDYIRIASMQIFLLTRKLKTLSVSCLL